MRFPSQHPHLPFFASVGRPAFNGNGNISIGIDELCVQILDGPCANIWNYGGRSGLPRDSRILRKWSLILDVVTAASLDASEVSVDQLRKLRSFGH